MNIPNDFQYGRFKLESYFVFPDKDETCNILINGICMTVTEPNKDECIVVSAQTAQMLNEGKLIRAYRLIDNKRINYSIRIINDWVHIHNC